MGGIQLIIRVRFTKLGYLKYLSHLDLVRLFTRSFSRSNVPIKYSEGFNPHPRFSIGNPLSLGIESESEYMDVELSDEISPIDFMNRMNGVLPKDIQIINAEFIDEKESLSSIIKWSHYEIHLWIDNEEKRIGFQAELDKFLQFEQVKIFKKKKKGKNKIQTEVNIVPLIGNVIFKGIDEDGYVVLNSLLRSGESGNLKPIELVTAINEKIEAGINLEMTRIKRLDAFAETEGNIYRPL